MDWYNSKIKKLTWLDIAMIKTAVFVFALLLAKLWEPILSLEWYWYASVFVTLYIITMFRIFRK